MCTRVRPSEGLDGAALKDGVLQMCNRQSTRHIVGKLGYFHLSGINYLDLYKPSSLDYKREGMTSIK